MPNSQGLDPKLSYRINAVQSGLQVSQMSDESIRIITNGFEECYVRRLIAKCDAPKDQMEILNSIQRAFDNIYIVDDWNGSPQYSRDVPEFFSQFRLDIEIGLSIAADNDHVSIPEVDSSPEAWMSASEELGNTLSANRNKLEEALRQIDRTAKQSLSQIDKMRNGFLKSMQKKFTECQNENKALREENKQLKARPISQPQVLDPFQRTVTYDNVVNYIANRDSRMRREELINMFEALLPKDMHEKFRDDVNEKFEAREEKRRASRRSHLTTPQQNSTQLILKVEGATKVSAYDIHDNNRVDGSSLAI